MNETGDSELLNMVRGLTPDQIVELVESLPPGLAEALVDELGTAGPKFAPADPIALAHAIGEPFRERAHLQYLSDRIVNAVEDVERGISRRIIIEMPPRSGKTTLATLLTSAWILSRHPDWPIVLASHDGNLATSWGRHIRRWVDGGKLPNVQIASDAGAASEWETTAGGSVVARSVRASLTGRGAKVLLIDDAHKDFVESHSVLLRDKVWDWWLSVAQTRLEPPSLVLVTLTRWHEDDFVGRLLSPDYEGPADAWEVIRMPAIAEENDDLGREPGEPLLSPLQEEDAGEAVQRWAEVRASVGEYVWAAMMQQRPAPARGAIFDAGWWKYWTTDPARVTEDGRVVLLDPSTLKGGKWLDSWDLNFGGTEGGAGSWVVGQRWVRSGANRYLIAQQRKRWSFSQTLEAMKRWAGPPDSAVNPHGQFVHQRLIEKKANGAAIIDVLQKELAGIKPVNPTTSKEVRARAVTPEIESGHVFLPHPSDPGNEWVNDFLSEVRSFPHDAYDDQVDTMAQALSGLRDSGRGGVTVPGLTAHRVPQSRTAGALTDTRRSY